MENAAGTAPLTAPSPGKGSSLTSLCPCREVAGDSLPSYTEKSFPFHSEIYQENEFFLYLQDKDRAK